MTAIRKVGDKVICHEADRFPGLYEIIKVNPKTYVMKSLSGGKNLRASHSLMADAPADGTVPTTSLIPMREHMWPGTVVAWSRNGIEPAVLYVVTADKTTRVNLVVLGATNGRYWRVPPSLLKVVPLEEIANYEWATA